MDKQFIEEQQKIARERFEKDFIDTQYVLGTDKKAYQEWSNIDDAEEALETIDTLISQTILATEAEVMKKYLEIINPNP